ncbi:Formin-like protein 5 isoform E [Glycine soja]|uniref:Formin-like protein 5 isoform E n=1 Tax=Glycine soja TaxID=3848 RepID=A0A445HQ36_GLYSO|nr:Formin-like protein 5 isoform E [Glycine soja]
MEETKDEEVEFVKDFLGMVLLNNVGWFSDFDASTPTQVFVFVWSCVFDRFLWWGLAGLDLIRQKVLIFGANPWLVLRDATLKGDEGIEWGLGLW